MIEVIKHPAGSDYTSGTSIPYNDLSMTISVGVNAPSMSFTTPSINAPRARTESVTILVDNVPLETIFIPVSVAKTYSSNHLQNNSSIECVGLLELLDEMVPLTPLTTNTSGFVEFMQHLQGYGNSITNTNIQGIDENTFSQEEIILTNNVNNLANDKTVDDFSKELISIKEALTRYALEDGYPLDAQVSVGRNLIISAPIRRGVLHQAPLKAGYNGIGDITENLDLSVGRIASKIIVGDQDNNGIWEEQNIQARYGNIELLASNGSAETIAQILSSELVTINTELSGDITTIFENSKPKYSIGDIVSVETDNGLKQCIVTQNNITIDNNKLTGSIGLTLNEWIY